jgi:hypothetical protein
MSLALKIRKEAIDRDFAAKKLEEEEFAKLPPPKHFVEPVEKPRAPYIEDNCPPINFYVGLKLKCISKFIKDTITTCVITKIKEVKSGKYNVYLDNFMLLNKCGAEFCEAGKKRMYYFFEYCNNIKTTFKVGELKKIEKGNEQKRVEEIIKKTKIAISSHSEFGEELTRL